MIELDLRTMLPKVREAFDNKTLQMFTSEGGGDCLYAGPCAIGVCIPKDQREGLDNWSGDGTGFKTLLQARVFKVPEKQVEDFALLQSLHDRATTWAFDKDLEDYKDSVLKFDEFLVSLEEMYLNGRENSK